MEEQEFLDAARRFAVRLAELSQRFDAETYEVLLKILRGVNAAFAQRGTGVDVGFTDRERELFTPEVAWEVARLMELLSTPGSGVRVDLGPSLNTGQPDWREHDRREVEGIARASGLEP
ncbi:hypothetical protein [Streptomyces gobiensis]|uniref:hypothetical protein n=1 Tax=Streptomyces gobiensis TaxID=2875706 RepID=UPI001E346B67|nr:hypothetical protein [Streptomyces gobiensis]UGY94215.1 hypothetical protein test1122_22455 [Streptomyces gobiensis]